MPHTDSHFCLITVVSKPDASWKYFPFCPCGVIRKPPDYRTNVRTPCPISTQSPPGGVLATAVWSALRSALIYWRWQLEVADWWWMALVRLQGLHKRRLLVARTSENTRCRHAGPHLSSLFIQGSCDSTCISAGSTNQRKLLPPPPDHTAPAPNHSWAYFLNST